MQMKRRSLQKFDERRKKGKKDKVGEVKNYLNSQKHKVHPEFR